ncbi:hypothetical protein BH10BAC3_BH10BAC3_33850 [soil metagenome]
MHKHILIAGGAGFVGSNLAIAFKTVYPHYQVSIFDNVSRKGKALNIARLEAAGAMFRHANTRVASDLVMETRIDVIIDAAGEPSVLAEQEEKALNRYWADPEKVSYFIKCCLLNDSHPGFS